MRITLIVALASTLTGIAVIGLVGGGWIMRTLEHDTPARKPPSDDLVLGRAAEQEPMTPSPTVEPPPPPTMSSNLEAVPHESAPQHAVERTAVTQPFKLSGNQRWVVLASRREMDEAIGIARYYSSAYPSARVMKANNGFYAVIIGPEHSSNINAFRERAKSIKPIPEDAFLSRGDSWAEEVWRTRSPILAEMHYNGKSPAKLNYGSISLSMAITQANTADANTYLPVLVRSGGR